MFDQLFRARVFELWNLFSATGDLQHQGEKGGFREAFVKQLLESILPHHFGIGSGVVVDRYETQSPQIDIIIYDKRSLPPFLERDGRGIYPVDSVLRVLEVKSTIDGAAIKQFLDMTWCFSRHNPKALKLGAKGRLRDDTAYYPLSGLFGFGTALVDFKTAIEKRLDSKFESGIIYCDGKGGYNIRRKDFDSFGGRAEHLKAFLADFVGMIEVSALSREPFALIEWLGYARDE